MRISVAALGTPVRMAVDVNLNSWEQNGCQSPGSETNDSDVHLKGRFGI